VPNRRARPLAQEFEGNMDVEVSADGNQLYFSRATWRLKGGTLGPIKASNIHLSVKHGRQFVFDENESNRVLANINTGDLEYAAAVSTDGLELFFTRLAATDLEAGTIRSRIMRAKRARVTEPFGAPITVGAIGDADFVEGPSISSDGTKLYYHKRVGDKFRIHYVKRSTDGAL